MLPDFSNIDYLRKGSLIQQKGWEVLTASGILKILCPYNPVLAGTLPLDIFIEGQSDLDISCEVYHPEIFIQFIKDAFSEYSDLSLRQKELRSIPSVIINFTVKNFPIEIVGQPLPVMDQIAVRHLHIEYSLLKYGGASLKKRVLDLKNNGIKTEPAFASLLLLEGDPYDALLNLKGDEHNRFKFLTKI